MSTTADTAPDPNQYRLPTNVKAIHYDIIIKTDLENLTFNGTVKVRLHINDKTSTIVLNSSELELRKATLYSESLKAEQLATFSSFNQTQERAVFHLKNALPADSEAELKIVYAGKLTGGLAGYYKSAWKNKGKTEHYAVTQFEPTAARRAFPCWDEPLLKSTYTITMISRADTVNLSNMPVETEELVEHGLNIPDDILVPTKNDSDKWKITKFQTTPLMSSYLVAFANGPFEFLETSVVMPLRGKTLPLRIYTTPDVIHLAQFALDTKVAVLPLYEKIFDVEYPLPKLDTLLASDFLGAMENWGLIIGRASEYSLDSKRPGLKAKVNVVTTQSHEVAHMWFGNITTMEWWDCLYLNEGFATLMGEVIIPGIVYPEWKVNSTFINQNLSRALELDAQPSSHPIEVECPDANHITQIFDDLSYSKAASVLRMLSNYVGEEKFLKGVSLYLKKNLFANSVTHDLWEGISTATGLDITQLMDNWITKMGFPVLTVTENAKGITVRQDRFLEMGPTTDPKDNETIWNVPLSLISTKDGNFSVDTSAILQEREKTILLDTSQTFKLNAGTVGVYRVLYTPERLVLIAKEAAKENSVFSLDDRLGLLKDAMALSKAGLAKLSSALTLIDSWKGETEYLVWQGIGQSLTELVSVWWEYPKIIDKLNAFRRTLFVPLVNKLGYEYPESDSIDTSLLRTLAVEQASTARDDAVVKELKSRFKHYLETGEDTKIPADLQRIVFIIAVREGGREEYDAIVNSYDKPKTPSESTSAIAAMTASRDVEVLQETLEFATNKMHDQDLIRLYEGMGASSEGRRLLTKYFHDNYEILYKQFGATFSFPYFVKFSSSYYASDEDLKMIENFYKDKDTSKYYLALGQALDSIRSRVAYVARSTDELWTWKPESSL